MLVIQRGDVITGLRLLRAGFDEFGEAGSAVLRLRLDIPSSTLAFHLRGLVGAGLVLQEKRSREVICRAHYSQVNAVIEFLREECCKGLEEEIPATPARRAG